jgi:hypothetical protein
MYAALWRLLPGPGAVKALQCLILLLAVVAVCFLWVFPAIAPYMPFNDNTIAPGPQPPGPTP